jgi:hypothetical protein
MHGMVAGTLSPAREESCCRAGVLCCVSVREFTDIGK